MKRILLIATCIMAAGGLWADETPKWTKKVRKAVFSVITYNEDNKILNTGNGFYIDEKGTGVSDYSLFKGAHKATVVTADGKELPVKLILGANDMYDIVRFRTEPPKRRELLTPSTIPGKKDDTVYILPYSTQNSVKLTKASILSADTISKDSYYYTVSVKTNIKDVSCPLVNSNGEVIGIIQRNSNENSDKSYALGIDYAKGLSTNALSGTDATLNSIKIKKGLPEDENQAQVFLFMMASKMDNKEYLELLNDFIGTYPQNIEGYLRRATYYTGENNEESVEKVEEDFEKMLKVAEKKEDAHYNISKILYSYNLQKHENKVKADWTLERALEEINSAIKISPEGIYYQLQGDIYFAMQKYEDAAISYEKVCKTPMKSADSFYSAAKARELVEGTEKSRIIALLDSAVNIYSKPYGKEAAPYIFERARVKESANLHREAVTDYNLFQEAMLGQVSAQFYVIRMQAEMQCRMYQQAINDINKAVETEPDNAEYWTEKGSVHIRVNQVADAIEALKKAVSLAPENPVAYRMLGYCQIKDKKTFKEGMNNLNRAKELGDSVAADLIKKYNK